MRVIVADDEFFARKALVKRIGELTREIESVRKRKTAGRYWNFWGKRGLTWW